MLQFSSVQSFSCVRLFATPWVAAYQASLSITNSRSSPKLMSIEWVMPSSHLILCRPLLFLSSILPASESFPMSQLFATPQTSACQASLSLTNSQSLLKFLSIKSVMASNHLILCHPLLLPPSIFPSLSVFSNESVLCIRWLKYGMPKEVPETIISVWNLLPLCFSFLSSFS